MSPNRCSLTIAAGVCAGLLACTADAPLGPRQPIAADYRPGSGAGMVTIGMGDNQFYGGANTVPGAMYIDIPLTHATMELDGVRIIENGVLAGAATANAGR